MLGLLALGLIALMFLGGNDDTGKAGDTTTGAETSGEAATGTLTADGTNLLLLTGDGASLRRYEDTQVQANGVTVQSVVSDEGFWIGESPRQQMFVFLAQGGESGPQVEEGENLSFQGTLKPLPADFQERFGLETSDGTDQLQQQAHYIEVKTDLERS